MAFEGWEGHIPPYSWARIMAMDIGGATPNHILIAAVCPDTQSVVAYDEINKVTTDMRLMAELALPKMKHEPTGHEYTFLAKVGDYENRIALDDMARHGVRFTNAVKQHKNVSIHRFSGYLHANPKRPFPSWHPKAGKLGAPLWYITPNCKELIKQVPIQKWKNEKDGTSMKDEMDRAVIHDAVDCALYIARILPAPATIPVPKVRLKNENMSLQSRLYYLDVEKALQQKDRTAPRRPYNPNHGDGRWASVLGY